MVAISVITPVRDMAPWLGEAIASVQAQTFTDWEMLIVDDGSRDGSTALAAAAAAADPRIRTLATAGGQGAAAARNLGLSRAGGAFVAFLDADDLFAPSKFEIELAAFAAWPQAAMVYGATRWWWPDGGRPDWLEPMAGFAGRLHRPPELFRRVLIEEAGCAPCTCAVLIRRAAAAAAGGFDDRFNLYEDQTLWARLWLRWPTYVHGAETSRYRQHAGSTSARAVREGRYHPHQPHAARADFLLWAGREAAAAGQDAAGLRRALRLALAAYPERRPAFSALDRGVLLQRAVRARAAQLARKLGRRLALNLGG